MLDKNGTSDFRTWAQLLVSTGDPSRPATAADCSKTVTDARAQALTAAGYKVVGRYLDERPSDHWMGKAIQPGELETIFRNGLRVFPISQYNGGALSYFSYAQGHKDATEAHIAAVQHGFNRGTVLYFAVDFDATDPDIDSHIIPYFNGVTAGLSSMGKRYIHGVYGSRNVCARITDRTYARYSFVSGMSTGFSGNMGFPLPANWSFNQIATVTVGSGDGQIEIDRNVHRPSQDPGVGAVSSPGYDSVDAFIAAASRLRELSVEYGKAGYSHDRHVLEYLRHPTYTDARWIAMVGEPDFGFIDFVKSKNIAVLADFKDPNSGVNLSVDHLAAAANGVDLHGPAAGSDVNPGDLAGWGGDLITFYAEWRRDSDRWSSGYTYCMDRLAKINVTTTFGFNDLIEDVDGHNIGRAVRGGTNIVEALRDVYQRGGHLHRHRDYYANRLGGTAAKAAAIADEMLTGGSVLSAGRTALIQWAAGTGVMLPSTLPGDKLDEFVKGYTDTVQDLVSQETAKAARLRAEGKL